MSSQKKTWIRPTQLTGWPKNKYFFSEHLVRVGDFIETEPWSIADHERFKKAVYAWAYRHKYHVSIYQKKLEKDLCISGAVLRSKAWVRRENYDWL